MGDAPISAATVRHRTAEALALLLGLMSSREVAALLGCDHSTVLRRGADLTAWSAADLITFLTMHSSVRGVMVRELAAPAHQVRPMEAEREVRDTVGATGSMITTAMEALKNGRVSATEARELAPLMRQVEAAACHAAETLEARARGDR